MREVLEFCWPWVGRTPPQLEKESPKSAHVRDQVQTESQSQSPHSILSSLGAAVGRPSDAGTEVTFLTSSCPFLLLSRYTVNSQPLHERITDSLKNGQMTRAAWCLPFLSSYVIALPQAAVCSRREEGRGCLLTRPPSVATSSSSLCYMNY